MASLSDSVVAANEPPALRAREGSASRVLRIGLLSSFCALLILGPLTMGAVEEWSVAGLEAGAVCVLLLWSVWQACRRDLAILWSPLFPPMVALAAVVLLQIAFHLTIYRYASISEFWLYSSYALLVFVAIQTLRGPNAFQFALVMAVFGSIYAGFAIVQGFTAGGRIYWRIAPQAGSVYGSYVNHNHYAGLIEMLFPLALVPVFNGHVRGARRGLLLFGAVLMTASVFLSQSRGGMIALLAEIGFLAAGWIRNFSPRKSASVALAFCLATALLLVWVAPAQLGSRISDFRDPSRLLIHRDSLKMFLAHPLLGVGLGNFSAGFPHYRLFFDGFFVNHAHDDYLELLLETGLLGFAAGLWFLVVLYRRGLANVRLSRNSRSAAISFAGLAGCTGLLVHSFMDFNLHIPGNAALFYVLCALAVAAPE